MGSTQGRDLRAWGAPLLLSAAVWLAYLPSLRAGFSDYDDKWLIEDNTLLAGPLARALPAILTDLSREGRMELGAEYLPVRDLFVWLERHVLGLGAEGMRVVSVLLYLAALLFLRGAALRAFGRALWVELAVLAFALHPVHVESVAWLSGQKDLLALLFCCAALWLHAGRAACARFGVPLLFLLALLSKSMSVALIALLLAHDLLVARRPEPLRYVGCLLVLAVTLPVHVHVGSVVQMYGPPAGGSHLTALMTMSAVVLRYLGTSVLPVQLSIRYDVPDRLHWDLVSLLGLLSVLALAAASLAAWRRGHRLPAWAFVWFFAPLLPVSQLAMQLENRMADRYLWLSVWSPCVLMAWSIGQLRVRKLAVGLATAVCVGLLGATLQRSVLFADDVLLFADALAKTERDTHAAYELGWAFEQRGQDALAIAAYREIGRRVPPGAMMPPGSRHMIARGERGLARLLAKHGRIAEANAVLDRLHARLRDRRLWGAAEPRAQ